MVTKGSGLSRKGVLIVAGVAVVIVLLYFGLVNNYLGARLSGPDVSSVYAPLVRHLLASQNHCYDNGTQYCEKYLGLGGEKEFTVAYLFLQPPAGMATNMIYGCFDAKSKDYILTTNPRECTSRRLSTFTYGYTAKSDAFESSVELFRCYNRSANNFLVTDDRRECELAAHTDEITSLGWAAAGGHLAQRRLEGLCLAAKQAGVLTNAYDGYCRNLSAASTSFPAPTGPTPPVPQVKSWQNSKNRFDVNNDNNITSQDLLVLVNSYNSKGVRDLVKVNEPTPPPFIDVNGDKNFTVFDIQAMQQCLNKGGKNC